MLKSFQKKTNANYEIKKKKFVISSTQRQKDAIGLVFKQWKHWMLKSANWESNIFQESHKNSSIRLYFARFSLFSFRMEPLACIYRQKHHVFRVVPFVPICKGKILGSIKWGQPFVNILSMLFSPPFVPCFLFSCLFSRSKFHMLHDKCSEAISRNAWEKQTVFGAIFWSALRPHGFFLCVSNIPSSLLRNFVRNVGETWIPPALLSNHALYWYQFSIIHFSVFTTKVQYLEVKGIFWPKCRPGLSAISRGTQAAGGELVDSNQLKYWLPNNLASTRQADECCL